MKNPNLPFMVLSIVLFIVSGVLFGFDHPKAYVLFGFAQGYWFGLLSIIVCGNTLNDKG